MPTNTVELGATSLTITWSRSKTSKFHYLWLRDNAPELRHPTTQHRLVETSTIPKDVRPASACLNDVGDLEVTWATDRAISVFSAQWLHAHDYSNGARNQRPQSVTWTADMASEIPRATHDDIVSDPAKRVEFLDGFFAYGLAFLEHVSSVPGTVALVAQDLGEMRITSWGAVFDVVSVADANSVAYTNLPLVVHTDEGYRNPVPTVQLQHFLVNDAQGGEATLTDGFRVANDLRDIDPEAFSLLASTDLRFHIADATTDHTGVGSIIETNGLGDVIAIRYSNHSATPFLLDFDELTRFYNAYQLFGAMREDPKYRLQIRMPAGSMYIVDNRRVMHGRTGFTSGGNRHLQSCYIERDELASRLAVLKRPFL